MKFCPVCENLLYISVTGGDGDDGDGGQGSQMSYHCKNCGSMQRVTGDGKHESICVLETRLGADTAGGGGYKRYMTPYLKHDPTLPRATDIRCPNPTCLSNGGAPASKEDAQNRQHEVIVVKYDRENMRYLYCCETCDTFWRTGEQTATTATATGARPTPREEVADADDGVGGV